MSRTEFRTLSARAGLAAVVVWGAGCFDPKLEEGISCTEEGACPPGQVCDRSRNQCVSERDVDPADGGSNSDPDAGGEGSPDAGDGADQERDLDLIFVVDDSSGMVPNQESLVANFPRFMEVLSDIEGGRPNLHIGVVSTDVGADPKPLGHPYVNPACEGKGHDGRFIVGPQDEGCSGIDGQWLVDKVDEAGKPVRNYDGELGVQFACMARLGAEGCGFEQPFEALKRALEDEVNEGFFRADAHLGVVILTDEDDCSAHDVEMFGEEPDLSLEESLGPLDSFRCTDYGVECDPVLCDAYPRDMRCEGERQNCRPRDDSPFMHTPEHYAKILTDFKGDPSKVLVAGIYGDPEPFSVFHEVGDNDVVYAKLSPSCDTSDDDAAPGVRLSAFLEAFPASQTETTSICDGDLSSPIEQIAQRFAAALAGS